MQIIHPASSFQLKFIDVSSHVVPEDEAKKLVYDTVWGPYNLETGPLFRALLLKLSPLEYILAITIHDLVADGPSLEILVRETSLLYESISKGNKSPLPEPIAQYSDFSSWQNECLIKEQGQESSSQKTEAMNQWVGQTEVSSNILKEPIVFSSALAEGLIELSEQENTTLFITVVTAYFLFLSRWKNKYDLTIAAPVVIRPDYKFEQVMGIFVQAIVLTVNLPENPNFAQTLRQVKNEFQKEYAKIFNLALNPTSAGAYSSTPPIDASINFLNYSPTSWSLPGINSTKYALPSPPVDQELPIDFHLQLEVDNKNISGSIVYIGDGVEIDELKKISKNFIELLNDFAKI